MFCNISQILKIGYLYVETIQFAKLKWNKVPVIEKVIEKTTN